LSVQPGTKQWDQLVAEGIAAVNDRNWKLGDIALLIAPLSSVMGRPNKSGSGTGLSDLLGQYAEEIGVSVSTMNRCRETSASWPKTSRVKGASWTAHSVLRSDDKKHLVVAGMTKAEAMEAAGQIVVAKTEEQERIEAAIKKATEKANKEADKRIEAAERAAKLAVLRNSQQNEKNIEAERKKAEKMAREREAIAAKNAKAKAEQEAMLRERELHRKAEAAKALAEQKAREGERARIKAEEEARRREAAKAAEAARKKMSEQQRREFDAAASTYLRAQKVVADSQFALKATDYQTHLAQVEKINDKHTVAAIEKASAKV